MSFVLVASAIGASAVIGAEVSTWQDRMKEKRRTGSMNLFSGDDFKRMGGEGLGIIPVVGDFAQKAVEDATFDEYRDGSPRDTGTWAGAGINAGMDVIKLATMGQGFGAADAVAEVAGDVAADAVTDAVTDVAADTLGDVAADTATDFAADTVGGVAANTAEQATGSLFGDAAKWGQQALDYAEATKDMVAGPVGQVQDAFGAVKDTLREPFTDALGDGLGNAAFNATGNFVTKPALGAMMNPDDPGKGAAQGAFSAAAGSLLDVGVDTGMGQVLPEGTFSNQAGGDAIRGVVGNAVDRVAQPLVGMGQSAIQKALTTPTVPVASRNPYNPQGGLWDTPYGKGSQRRY